MQWDKLIKENFKEEALHFILEEALKVGFGSLSKTDIEVVLFSTLLKFGDDRLKSDYELSKVLMITPRRVQSLKEKASLKYTKITRNEAIEYFLQKLSKARLNQRYVEIPIGDLAVKNELEALLDQYDILQHTQLNVKIFKLRIDDLFMMISLLGFNNQIDAKTIESDIRKDLKEKSKEIATLLGQVEFKHKEPPLSIVKKIIQSQGFNVAKELFPVLLKSSDYAMRFIENLPI